MNPSLLFTITSLKYSLSKSHLAVLLCAYSAVLYRIYALPAFEQPASLTVQQGISPIKSSIITKIRPYKIVQKMLRFGLGVILYWTRLFADITKGLNVAVVRISEANLSLDSKDPQLPDIFLSAT